MAKSAFDDPRFNDEAAAFAYIEEQAVAARSSVPALRGNTDQKAHSQDGGQSHSISGLYNCNECKGQFAVRQGTASLQKSRIPAAASLVAGDPSDVR